jgi:hypothetical protein
MPEIILPADRAVRKQVLIWSTLLALLGLAGIHYVASYLDDLTALQLTDPQLTAEKYSRLILLLAAGDALIACSLGGVLISFAYTVLRSGQCPPPGMKVPWNTRLRTGRAAAVIAVTALALASGIIVAGLWVSLHMVWLVRGRDFHSIPGAPPGATLQTRRGSAIINTGLAPGPAEEQA